MTRQLKMEQLINSTDVEMRALGVVLILDYIKDNRDYHKIRSVIKASKLSSGQKLLIKTTSRDKSLNIWVNGGTRDYQSSKHAPK